MKVSSSRGYGLRLHTTLENWGHWGDQLMNALCSILHSVKASTFLHFSWVIYNKLKFKLGVGDIVQKCVVLYS